MSKMKRGRIGLGCKFLTAFAVACYFTNPAFAHLDPAEHGSFAAGLSHPLSGLDHILAMVGVGLWAALLGRRAILTVPSAFVIVMMAGFGLAMADIGLPFVEPVVAASVVVVGLFALSATHAPTIVAMGMVGFFALFHGHAHGGELGGASAWPFMAGFALATAFLHGLGVGFGSGFGRIAGNFAGRTATRIIGGLTAIVGLWVALGAQP